jgi:DNA-binding transcriptional LysR family regulator
MEFRQLLAFVAVAREGSFTQAAEHLNLRQPSLSARIRRLEASLGGQLIDRRTRPIRLTPLGEALLPYAVRALAILEAAQELARDHDIVVAEQVRLGCPFSVATYLMPEVVDRFSKAFPKAELFIETGNSDYVVSQLNDGLINLALAAAFPKFLSQSQLLLSLHDEMVVAVAPAHELAGLSDVAIAHILRYRVLLIHWGPSFHAYIENLRQLNPESGPLIRLPLAGALPMAQQPDTATFMPRRLVAPSGLVEVKVRDFSFSWDVALMTRPGRSLTFLEQEFLNIVTAVW